MILYAAHEYPPWSSRHVPEVLVVWSSASYDDVRFKPAVRLKQVILSLGRRSLKSVDLSSVYKQLN